MTLSLKKDYPGLFITLEGGEGSGKTTLLQKLSFVLSQKGYEVVQTREPGGSALGNQIRQLLLNQDSSLSIGPLAEVLLFLAARAQHIEELIQPALNRGAIVLCDRFNDSTIAYQGALSEENVERVHALCGLVCGSTSPDLTLFLDVNPAIGLYRTQRLTKDEAKAGELDRIEARKLDFHEKVRDVFLHIVQAEPDRVYRINAEQSQAKVYAEALNKVESLINLRLLK